MAERAVAAGARLRLGVRATGLITRTDRVAVEAIETDLPVIYTARAAIIAAGVSPRLTQSIGLGKIKDAALGFQVAVEATRPLDVEIFLGQKIAPGFFGWLAPVAENRAHVGLIVRGRGDQNITYLLDLLRQQGKISAVTGPVACRPIPLSRLGRTYADRVLVVGDAAGQVKSTTGGGIFYGLLCADIAADTLVHAFDRGDLSASVLKEYERRWMAELGWDLRLGRFGRKIFERLSDHRLDALILKARDSGLLDRLLADDSVSYDRHGRAILKAAATLWPALLVP
jgi:flavin-dependent dehydrogenase